MKKICKLISIVALVFVLGSCNLFMLPFKAKMGTIRIQLSDPVSKTVHPFDSETGMTVESYAITFTAPDGSSDEKTADTDGLVEKKDAIEGSWTVEARALNAAGGVLGKGTSTVEVVSGKIQTVRIEIKPAGIGTISIKIDWKDNPLVEPDYIAKAFLVDAGVDPVELTLTQDAEGKSASWSASTIAAGSHEIIARLVDASGKVLWGQIESFMVYEGLTSSKTFIIASAQMNRKPEAAPSIGAMERAPNQIAVNWSCASARVDKYRLEKKVEPDGSWIFLAEPTYVTTRYVDTSVVQGASYSYRVRASNTFGETDWSTTRQVSVPKIVEVTGDDNTIKTDTTWTSENTYEVENIQINAGVTLTIQPGTRIIFRRNEVGNESQYYMVVKGTLKALGTAEEPVIFTTKSLSPNAGSWADIRFTDESRDAIYDADGIYSSGCILQNCIVEYAKGITVTDSAPYIENLFLRNVEGISFNGSAGIGKVQRILNLSGRSETSNNGRFTSSITHALIMDGVSLSRWNSFSINGKANLSNLNVSLDNGWDNWLNLNGEVAITKGTFRNGQGFRCGAGKYTFDGIELNNFYYGMEVNSNPTIIIRNSLFRNNQSRHLNISRADFNISKTEFLDSRGTGVEINENSTGEFAYNTIKNSSSTALTIGNPGSIDLHHNNILDNTSGGYAVSVTNASEVKLSGNNIVNPKALREIKLDGMEDFFAGANWWGSEQKPIVNARIYDGFDTFEDGYVRFEPAMIRKVTDSDIIVLPSGKTIKEVYGIKTKLAWRAVGGEPTAYRVQASTNASFTSPFLDETVDIIEKVLSDLEFETSVYWRVAPIIDGVEGLFGPSNQVDVRRLCFSTGIASNTMVQSSSKKAYYWGGWLNDIHQSSTPWLMDYTDFIKIRLSRTAKFLALKEDGTLWAWGQGYEGQLGIGSKDYFSSPRKIEISEPVIKIDGGYETGFAILESGTLFGWGYNQHNQISPSTTESQLSPVQILNLPKIADVSTTYLHVVALDTEGSVWAWGYNNSGQCGTAASERQSIPIKIDLPGSIVAIASGNNFSVALGADGKVYIWGSFPFWGFGIQPWIVEMTNKVKKISAANGSLLLLDDEGSLYSMGENGNGQLGLGDTQGRITPERVDISVPIYEMSIGESSSFAVDIDGRIWAWGYNGWGNLGDGTTNNRYAPKEIFLP